MIDVGMTQDHGIDRARIEGKGCLVALFILDDPIFRGLAISLIFGISVSTLLTLFVIPVLYYALGYRRTALPPKETAVV